MDFYRV